MANLNIRKASVSDISAVINLIADDQLGATREQVIGPVSLVYRTAFERIERQNGNDIYIAEINGEIIGCMQLTFITGLSRKGLTRCQIEAVRVSKTLRSQGIGKKMMVYAIDLAKTSGCGLVQLTTDNTREDAHRFYKKLGFVASHVGMKLDLLNS
ncbi:MAG: GNAT family N-acetyltransferase [Sneathiella sp.]